MNKKSVLVTGSSRGIGRACAIAFAKAGYHVFINCRQNIALLHSLQDEILSCGGTCTLLPGNSFASFIETISVPAEPVKPDKYARALKKSLTYSDIW